MRLPVGRDDVFGFLRPATDSHTLGIDAVSQLLNECGLRTAIADAAVSEAANAPSDANNIAQIEQWLRAADITRLGFSYRLDPQQGADLFGRLMRQLEQRKLFTHQGGFLRAIYFAGAPAACDLVRLFHTDRVPVFYGDETPTQVLARLGVPTTMRPAEIVEQIGYDDMRLRFGRDLVKSERYRDIKPVDRSSYGGYGGRGDRLVSRLWHSAEHQLPPLMRANVGPYLADREEAVRLMLDWTRQLAATELLDVLSISTSWLTQSNFGENWGDRLNGGGVPIDSIQEYQDIWEAARPMLVRTHAGTSHIPQLARLYEDTLSMAWHALSFWWFCKIDGRGPCSVRENLEQHIQTLALAAQTDKPVEANTAQHFALRGADDVTCIVSSVLAARAAKEQGVKTFVLQVMLNTPKYTWGVQDLAKARALLLLTRELEDAQFRVGLQPRAGMDFFSHDTAKAKAQLAAMTALMDDIEPNDPTSPPMIHVVGYTEGSRLTDPAVMNESIQITQAALMEYRQLRTKGEVPDMGRNSDVQQRTEALASSARAVLAAIESTIDAPYSAEGLYLTFLAGFLPVPYLWECREEFSRAVSWPTRLIRGGMHVVDATGAPIDPAPDRPRGDRLDSRRRECWVEVDGNGSVRELVKITAALSCSKCGTK